MYTRNAVILNICVKHYRTTRAITYAIWRVWQLSDSPLSWNLSFQLLCRQSMKSDVIFWSREHLADQFLDDNAVSAMSAWITKWNYRIVEMSPGECPIALSAAAWTAARGETPPGCAWRSEFTGQEQTADHVFTRRRPLWMHRWHNAACSHNCRLRATPRIGAQKGKVSAERRARVDRRAPWLSEASSLLGARACDEEWRRGRSRDGRRGSGGRRVSVQWRRTSAALCWGGTESVTWPCDGWVKQRRFVPCRRNEVRRSYRVRYSCGAGSGWIEGKQFSLAVYIRCMYILACLFVSLPPPKVLTCVHTYPQPITVSIERW